MNWQEFEDSMMDMSQAHETPVDTDALWARLNPKKRRRFLPWFWWAIGAAGLLLAGGGYWQYRSNLGATTSLETTRTAPTEVTTSYAPATPSTRPANLPNETAQNDTPETNASSLFIASKGEIGTPTASPAAVLIAIPAISSVSDPISNSGAPVAANPIAATLKTAIPFLPIDLRALPDKRVIPVLPTFHFDENTLPPPPQKAPGKAVWVGANMDYQQWHIFKTDSVYAEGLPRTFERNTESISASLLAQIPVTRRFTVTAGLGYQQQNFTFSRVTQWDSTYYVPVTNQYSPDYSALDSSQMYWTRATFTRRIVHHNRIQSWSIPLSVSYTFPLGRVQLAPYCGVQFNLFQRATGRIMGYENQPTDLNATGIYNRPWSVSVMGGLAAETALSPRTKVSLRAGVTQDLTNRTTNSNPFSERFLQYGVGIGVFRKF